MTPNDRYDSLLQYYAEQYGLDWRILKAQIHAESNFDPDAVSRAGAVGLAQFMPKSWREWADATPGIQTPPADLFLDPRDPEDAIRSQAAYMAWLLDKCRDLTHALACYNWGFGHMKKLLDDPDWLDKLPQETRNYVQRVLAAIGQ